MGRTVVLGGVRLELHLKAPRVPGPGEAVAVPGQWQVAGRGLAWARALGRAGLDPVLLVQVGDDAAGRVVEGDLRDRALDVRVARRRGTGTATAVAVTTRDGGFCWEVEGTAGSEDPARVVGQLESLDAVGGIEWLVLHGETRREANLVAALWVKDHGGQVALDPEPSGRVGEELVAVADYLLPSPAALGWLCRARPPKTREETTLLAEWVLDRHRGLSGLVVSKVAGSVLVATRTGHWWHPLPVPAGDDLDVWARVVAARVRGQGWEAALQSAGSGAPPSGA
ncbi:MAG: carbohydrate kinase family protein [Firmicutes bacterium]|nr:carbohydrate kinase family protein [Alicyclobacillaceae bacterium]MCL6498062.1 carbohydrate kinase family protein [Bacillota bacterium]